MIDSMPEVGTLDVTAMREASPGVSNLKKQNLKELLEKEYGLRFNQYNQALCPFHDDHEPSLCVFKGKDGFWKWKCHGCKKKGDYFDFKALIEKKPLQDVLKSIPGQEREEASPLTGRKPIAIYVYADEEGRLLSRKLKFDSHTYCVQRFENGRWVSGLNGTRRVLYNLPELISASQVFLLEGEKDCDTLKALGLVATTMGSISQWKPDFADSFRDKDVAICFDVGNEAVAERAAQDITSVAKTVRILSLPGLTEREQDITDWFEKMGDASAEEKKAKLLAIVEETPLFVPTAVRPESKPATKALTLSEFMKKGVPPRDVYMERWAEREQLTILGGNQKAGKSILAINLGLSIASGKDFLGFKVPQPRRVLYVQQEISEPAMHERLKKMTSQAGLPYSDNFMIENTTGTPLKLTNRAGIERLRELLELNKPDLLILDPLSTFHNVEENSASEMSAVLEAISVLKSEFKVGVLVIHHYGKPSLAERKGSHRFRGSSIIGDRADFLIMLDEAEPRQDLQGLPSGSYARISFMLRNDPSPEPIAVLRNPEILWYRRASQGILQGKKISEERIVEVIRAHGGKMMQSELVRRLRPEASRGTILKAIQDAVKAKLVEAIPLPGRGKPVLLRLQEGQS